MQATPAFPIISHRFALRKQSVFEFADLSLVLLGTLRFAQPCISLVEEVSSLFDVAAV